LRALAVGKEGRALRSRYGLLGGKLEHLRARGKLAQLVAEPNSVRAQPASLDITPHALQPGILGGNLRVEQRARGREADEIARERDRGKKRLSA
jgi:hypothetical protein